MMISSPLSSLGWTFLISSLAEAPVLAWKELYKNQTYFLPGCLWPGWYSWSPWSHSAGWRHNRLQCRWSPVWRSRSSWPPSPPTCTASTCEWGSTTLRRRRGSREGSTSTEVGRGWEKLWQTLPEKSRKWQQLRMTEKKYYWVYAKILFAPPGALIAIPTY